MDLERVRLARGDSNRILAALFVLSSAYQTHAYWRGMCCATREKTKTERWFRGVAARAALHAQTAGLIAHDHELIE